MHVHATTHALLLGALCMFSPHGCTCTHTCICACARTHTIASADNLGHSQQASTRPCTPTRTCFSSSQKPGSRAAASSPAETAAEGAAAAPGPAPGRPGQDTLGPGNGEEHGPEGRVKGARSGSREGASQDQTSGPPILEPLLARRWAPALLAAAPWPRPAMARPSHCWGREACLPLRIV